MTRNKLFSCVRLASIGIALIACESSFASSGITLTIDQCYQLAKENYPLIKQMALIEKTTAFSLDNASKAYLPQANIYGQATYQSAVTQIPISLPNVTIPSISKDQYKLYGEVVQPLTDIITVNHQKELIKVNAEVEQQKLETELYRLKERINQIFFGILLMDEQLKQNDLLRKDIQIGIDKTNAAIANGTALKSNAEILQAEMLKTDQHVIELKATREAYIKMLSVFTGEDLDENIRLEMPSPILETGNVSRPELRTFDLQQKAFDVQNTLINSKNLPHFNLFFQGGYGRPALNFLSNDFEGYYITGLRLNWNISGFYTAHKEKEILRLSKDLLDVQKETFLFNTNLTLSQQNAEVKKYQQLITSDDQIILLREKIKTTANAQLEYGSITGNDFLTYVNAENQARQSLVLHRVQMLLAQYNYQTTSGN